MHLDARKLEKGTILEADVCIVGSGPAGITLARALAATGREVVVLESGGRRRNRRAQGLSVGEVEGGPYAALQDTRHRQVGGTANVWNTPVNGGMGAKYVPLDSWDFEGPPDHPLMTWPFDASHLEPFYRRAQEVCGLGPFLYGGDPWGTPDRPSLQLEGGLATRVYQFGSGVLFTRGHASEMLQSPRVRLCSHATVTRLEVDSAEERVTAAVVTCPTGKTFRVRARRYVLAAGGIENARLLLLSGEDGKTGPRGGAGLGNRYGWVGRCFMEHPRDYSLSLTPYAPRLFSEAMFFDPHRAEDGTVVGGRIGLLKEAMEDEELPNASVTLLPRIRERSPLLDRAARLWFCPHSSGRRGFRGGYGWSRMKTPARWLDGFRLVVNLEQRPDPENRVLLAGERDALGQPRARLCWRWREEEQAGLERLREYLASRLERSGLGRVHIQKGVPPDPNACHHAGTTRMSEDPKGGVVNAVGRVHEVENLYITGGSVFPSVGYANPTLTIVALALRLAEHLRQA